MDFNSLTSTLTSLVSTYASAYDRVQPIAQKVLGSLILIEITLAGLYLALDGSHPVSSLFNKILKIGFWTYITTNFHVLVKVFSDSLVAAGLLAAGQHGSPDILLDPSRIAGYGATATEALITAIENISALDFVDALIFGLVYIAIMSTYLLMAVQVFLAVAEFYLISALAGVLIGFGISQHLRFLAEKAIGAVVACSVKLMVLAYIMATVEPILASARFAGPEIKFAELWALLLTSGTIMLFTWTAPSLAAALLSGSPSLSAGGAAQNVASGAMMVAGVGGFIATIARSAGAAVSGGGRGVAPGGPGGGSSGTVANTAFSSALRGGVAVSSPFASVPQQSPASFSQDAQSQPASPVASPGTPSGTGPSWLADAHHSLSTGSPPSPETPATPGR